MQFYKINPANAKVRFCADSQFLPTSGTAILPGADGPGEAFPGGRAPAGEPTAQQLNTYCVPGGSFPG